MANIPLPDAEVTTQYILDSKVHLVPTQPMMAGAPLETMRVLCEWQENTLLVTERNVAENNYFFSEMRFFLTADRLQLVELITTRSKFADVEQRLVFDK